MTYRLSAVKPLADLAVHTVDKPRCDKHRGDGQQIEQVEVQRQNFIADEDSADEEKHRPRRNRRDVDYEIFICLRKSPKAAVNSEAEQKHAVNEHQKAEAGEEHLRRQRLSRNIIGKAVARNGAEHLRQTGSGSGTVFVSFRRSPSVDELVILFHAAGHVNVTADRHSAAASGIPGLCGMHGCRRHSSPYRNSCSRRIFSAKSI